jgi:hypothetical protein
VAEIVSRDVRSASELIERGAHVDTAYLHDHVHGRAVVPAPVAVPPLFT